MALAPGTRLGPYEIDSALGAGGMGEVYRARDTRLDRTVAIKVLPSEVAGDPDLRARFEREARAVAALDHPHICGIYDVGSVDSTHYLVMPHLEGQTLAARLEKGPLPLDQALKIATEIADALDKAHRQGIVHRDLKPANVMLTKAGAKLLDFGLAKLKAPAGPISMSGMTRLGTSGPGTAHGTILGTVQYMAPEQVEGKDADARSDIWALGVVVYEMVTGARPFTGESPASIMGAILKDAPAALSSQQPLASSSLDHIVRACLAKEPDERWQSAGDVKRELKWIADTPAHVPDLADGGAAMRHRSPKGWIVAALTSALLLVTLPAAWRQWQPAQTEAKVVRLELSVPPDVELYAVAGVPLSISPDGTLVAFVGNHPASRSTFVRALDQSDTKMLRGTELAASPFFALNNTTLGFIASDSSIKRASLKDGQVVRLSDGADWNSGGAFAPDGRIMFLREGTLWELPAGGGTPKQLTTLDTERHEIAQQWPALLPGGRVVLFTSLSAGGLDAPRIDALTLADGKRKNVLERAAFPIYTATGHLLFLRDGALVAAPFDTSRLEPTGEPVRVVENVGVTGSGAPIAAVSANGTLVYRGATGGRLVSVTRQGAETLITDVSRTYTAPRLSPDGQRIVVVSDNALWLHDTTRRFTRLSPSAPNTAWPVWTPDGLRVWYRSLTGLQWIQADGSGRGGTIPGTSQEDAPGSVSPDGENLVFLRTSPDTSGDIYVVPLRGEPTPRPFVKTSAYEGGPQFSRDGRWIAYVSNDSGPFQVYVRPFPGPDRRVQVSTEGGSSPRWSRNGNELFYRNGNRMMAVQITTRSQDVDPVLSVPKLLFEAKYAAPGNTMGGYDVSLDDQHFVFVREDATASRFHVVLNWTEELKRLVPVR